MFYSEEPYSDLIFQVSFLNFSFPISFGPYEESLVCGIILIHAIVHLKKNSNEYC